VFRVREKGVKPVRGGAAGDLFCRVVVETPVSLNAEQKELLKKFEASLQEGAGAHKPREQTFLDGVKKFFTGAVD
jgi:molecular chaperone DnaJ